MNARLLALFLAALAGNESALAEFVELLVDRLRRYCYSRLGNWEDAEDATQNICLALWRLTQRGLRRPPESVEQLLALIFTIARRECGRILEQRSRQPVPLDPLDEVLSQYWAVEEGVEAVDLDDERQFLQTMITDALANLQREDRWLLRLRYFEAFNATEIGRLLDLESGTVRARLSAARERLRQLLESRAPS